MVQSPHFRHFTAAVAPPAKPLPETFEILPVPDIFLAIHHAADYHLERQGKDWVFLTGLIFHIEERLSLAQMAKGLLNAADPLDEIDHWAGSFAALRCVGGQIYAYHDPAPDNKIYYRHLQQGGHWIGSDPMLSRYWQDLQPHHDPECRHFHASKWLNKRAILVGEYTPFQGVFQVLANHCFNWQSARHQRIFPRAPRREISVSEAIAYLVPRMQHVIAQAVEGKRVHMAITAGWDSRLILAASQPFAQEIDYFTFQRAPRPDDDPDLVLPAQMARDLGFSHRVVKVDPVLPAAHKKNLDETFTVVADYRYTHFLSLQPNFDPEELVLIGTISEVGKNYLEHIPVHNGKQAVRALHFVEHPWLIRYYEAWLAERAPEVRQWGYRMLDFLHWEQDISNFAGGVSQYGNYVVNVISPFNAGKILATMLAVDPAERDKHWPRLYEALIRQQWPALMNYPLNPFPREKKIRLMKQLGVYNLYKYLDNRLIAKPFKD